MIKASPDLTVEIKIDASKQSWGAVCQEAWTQEVWSEQKNLHINVLKLKAVTFAVQAFTKDKRDCHVHLRVDNTTAVAQINKMDGTWSRDLLLVAKDLWQYCTKRSITLTVEHLRECRTQWWTNNRGSWTYNAFTKWTTSGPTGGGPIRRQIEQSDSDLCELECGPRSMENRCAHGTMAQIKAYAFSSFCLIGRCLAKVTQESADLVFATPVWQAHPCYPKLLAMSIDSSILLPSS